MKLFSSIPKLAIPVVAAGVAVVAAATGLSQSQTSYRPIDGDDRYLRMYPQGYDPMIEGRRDSTVAGRQYQGDTLAVDLPGTEQIKNIGSRVDGLGMCVMSSIEMAARAQGLEQYRGLRDWCAKYPGGAYPSKVDRQLKKYCQDKGLPDPQYIQYEGPDPRQILKLCSDTGRMACITYAYGPRYPGRIAHMTCCPLFGDKWGVCLDNNFPGEDKYEWMTTDELVNRIKGSPGGSAWVFAWLAVGQTPSPKVLK